MCGVKHITFALWINILSVITGQYGFEVELTPSKVLIEVGEELELICHVNACPVNVTFMWNTLLDKSHGGKPKDEQTVSSLLIRNITVKHEMNVVCKVICEGKTIEKKSAIHVFSFPQDPVFPKVKSLIANQTQKLSCTVHNVYPLERLQIEWLRGDKILHVDDSDLFNKDHAQNYSFVFDYTPSVLDLGKNISCKATLKSTEIGLQKTRNSIAEYGPGTITVSSTNNSVELGGHLEITCHADGNPKPTITWWKEENERILQSQNERFIINNASWSQAGWYHCDANNSVGSQQMRVKVIVLGPPNIPQIQVSYRGDLKEGENITILCSSDDGSAELTLYKESQSAGSGALNEPTVLLKIPYVQISDSGIYICEAKNHFGTERSTINITVVAHHNVEKKPDLPMIILPTVGSVSLLTAAGLLIRYCRKKDRNLSSNITLS